jgi:hypothetical protein
MLHTYLELTAAHPLLAAFVQFALLGTLGEVLSRMLRARRRGFPFGPLRTLLKVCGWGLLGIYIKFMFTVAVAGLEAVAGHGYPPAALAAREGAGLWSNALALSVVLNVMLGPSMMSLHRLLDNAIDRALDGRSAGWQGLAGSIGTLVWIWIPLHTITFCTPSEVRIGIAAVLSLVLGLVMGAFARPVVGAA